MPVYVVGQLKTASGKFFIGAGSYIDFGFNAEIAGTYLYKKDKITGEIFMKRWDYSCGIICDIDYLATVRRLGLITFRITMIFTTLRIIQIRRFTTPFVCSDTDFNTVLEMIKILVQHAIKVFSSLPAETTPHSPPIQQWHLFQALPQQFEKSRYNEIAAQLQIPENTANKWLTKFIANNLLIKQAHGSYSKKDT